MIDWQWFFIVSGAEMLSLSLDDACHYAKVVTHLAKQQFTASTNLQIIVKYFMEGSTLYDFELC